MVSHFVPHKRWKVGIVGATGMVGQRFVSLLAEHPWFELVAVGASPRSAGKTYGEAVADRWTLPEAIPSHVASFVVRNGENPQEFQDVDFVFCAVDMDKAAVRALEEAYARAEIPVVSNNSAHRETPDVPMIIPEVNPEHAYIIPNQRKRLATRRGFIAVKPNCSLQCYVPPLHALKVFEPQEVIVSTYQAVSGAGKTLASWPEMQDNVIPFIKGEEEKSEKEPLKIWGEIEGSVIASATRPIISAQCVRVPVSDGHLATVSVRFKKKPSYDEILAMWRDFKPEHSSLPSSPERIITYFTEENRPQTRIDRELHRGMGFYVGRLRPCSILHWRFVALSHNTLRGAAGGAVLTAELLAKLGFFDA